MRLQTTGDLAKRFQVHPRQISRVAYEHFQPNELQRDPQRGWLLFDAAAVERVRQELLARKLLTQPIELA